MTVYDNSPQGRDNSRDAFDAEPRRIGGDARAGYRPGWVWIPLAVLLLLTVLVMGIGFAYGGYADGTRAYDNGTSIEQTGGDTTQPGTGVGPVAPELGNQPQGEERSSIPEAAPPLANDGQ